MGPIEPGLLVLRIFCRTLIADVLSMPLQLETVGSCFCFFKMDGSVRYVE